MIFLCFNINDREAVAEQILYHMSSFGFHVWYDRKDNFLGNDRFLGNIVNGADNPNNKYSIVIMSKHFDSGNYCKKELDVIKRRFLENKTHIFPIMYDIDIEDIPKDYAWLTDLVCKIVNKEDEKIFACYHIVAKITSDMLSQAKYNDFTSFLKANHSKDYISDLVSSYESIDMNNYNARMALLYTLYLYIKRTHNLHELKAFYYKGFEKLFSYAKLNIKTDKRELQILENLSALLLSTYY